MKSMVIINGGLPRSGTVFVGQILSAVLRLQGRDWTRYNPQERRHLPDFAGKVRGWQGPGDLLVHTHLIDAEVTAALTSRPDSLLIWNYRDPRDALVSLCKLHDMALKDGLHAMGIYLSAERVAAAARGVVHLRYETMVQDAPATIRRLAGCLGSDLDDAAVAQIADETSPERHTQLMQQLRRGTRPGHRITTLRRTLIEDPETLINDRHIQSGASGRWRQELTAEQQAAVAEALGPAARVLGYDETA